MEWATILTTKNTSEAELCKAKLHDNNIKAIIFDKKDSVYPLLGQLQVKVLTADLEIAKTLMNTFNAE
jgi:Putative prokaryotic signal transducing protein